MPDSAANDALPAGTLLSPVPAPEHAAMLDTAQPSAETLALLRTRRSIKAQDLRAPGPTPEQLAQLLEIAARVPDHGKLAPWRFIVFEGDARAAFGDRLAKIFRKENPHAKDVVVDFERTRFTRAPVVVGVVSSPIVPHKIPKWEQRLSAGAACQTLLIAAAAMGFAAQWLTEWCAYSDEVDALLGLKGKDRIAGFVYIGTPCAQSMERPRADLASRVTRWTGA